MSDWFVSKTSLVFFQDEAKDFQTAPINSAENWFSNTSVREQFHEAGKLKSYTSFIFGTYIQY